MWSKKDFEQKKCVLFSKPFEFLAYRNKFCFICKTIADPTGTTAPEGPPEGDRAQTDYAHPFVGFPTNFCDI